MKKSKVIMAALLTLSMAFSLMGAQVFAASSNAGGGFGNGTTTVIDPANPEDLTSDGVQNPDRGIGTGDTGIFSINVVPGFDFGQELSPVLNNFSQVLRSSQLGTTAAGAPRYDIPYLQVSDYRGNGHRPFSVQVSASQFTNGLTGAALKTLPNARLVFGAGRVNGTLDESGNYTGSIPTTAAANIVAGSAASVATIFRGDDQFYGTWVSRFYSENTHSLDGNVNYNQVFASNVMNDFVQLRVQRGTVSAGEHYSATVTWTLVNA